MPYVDGEYVWRYYCRFCKQGTGVAGTGPFPRGVYRDYAGNEKQPMVVVKAGKKLIWIPLCAVCGHVSDSSVIPDWSGPAPKQVGATLNVGMRLWAQIFVRNTLRKARNLVTLGR